MEKMTICVMTPNEKIFHGQINYASIYRQSGSFTILPHHTPMIISLESGEVEVEEDNQNQLCFAIDAGMIEVSANHINVLSQVAVIAETRQHAKSKLTAEQLARQKQNAKEREQLIRSEMELYRLLRETGQAAP